MNPIYGFIIYNISNTLQWPWSLSHGYCLLQYNKVYVNIERFLWKTVFIYNKSIRLNYKIVVYVEVVDVCLLPITKNLVRVCQKMEY